MQKPRIVALLVVIVVLVLIGAIIWAAYTSDSKSQNGHIHHNHLGHDHHHE